MYRASHRYADVSPYKVRRIVNLIRRCNCEEALDRLKFVHNRGARLVERVIKSAMANAEDLGAREPGSLVVLDARVDEAPVVKRFQPHARGMAFPILKRSCHISVGIE